MTTESKKSLKKVFQSLFLRNHSLRDDLFRFFQSQGTPITNDQLQMVLNVVHVARYDADKIKIPINKIVDLPMHSSLANTIAALKKSGHSRIPVYEEKEGLKNYIGLLYAKDILSKFTKRRKKFKLKDYMRNIRFVSEMQKLLSLLRDMRIQQTHLVLTVNEYGDVTGLITLEDILEEIVGDIRDEHDPNKKLITEIGHRQYRVDASLPLSDLNKELTINLPEEKFNTLAGFILHEMKGNPKKGTEIKYGFVRLRLEKFAKQHVETVLVRIVSAK